MSAIRAPSAPRLVNSITAANALMLRKDTVMMRAVDADVIGSVLVTSLCDIFKRPRQMLDSALGVRIIHGHWTFRAKFYSPHWHATTQPLGQ